MAKDAIFRDFNVNFKANPFNGDLSLVKDEKSVAQALKNIILTDRGEVPFNQELGGDVNALLFELPSFTTIATLKERIELAITNFEPRIEIVDIDIRDDSDNNRYHIQIVFNTVLSELPTNISFFIERIL